MCCFLHLSYQKNKINHIQKNRVINERWIYFKVPSLSCLHRIYSAFNMAQLIDFCFVCHNRFSIHLPNVFVNENFTVCVKTFINYSRIQIDDEFIASTYIPHRERDCCVLPFHILHTQKRCVVNQLKYQVKWQMFVIYKWQSMSHKMQNDKLLS